MTKNYLQTLDKKWTNRGQMSDIVIDKDIVTDIVNNQKEKEIKEREKIYLLDIPRICKKVIKNFNRICISFEPIKTISFCQQQLILNSLRYHTIDDLTNAFQKAQSSDYLKGANESHWKPDFDWIIDHNNIQKILDGRYQDYVDCSHDNFDSSEGFEDNTVEFNNYPTSALDFAKVR